MRCVFIFATLFLVFGSHLQLHEDVAVAAIVNSRFHGLAKADSDCAKVDVMRLNLDDSVTTSTNDFQGVFLKEIVYITRVVVLDVLLGEQTRARVVKSNGVLEMIVDVFGVYWHIDVIVFLLQSSEGGHDFALFVGLQESFGGCELDFVLVFVWDFPFILEWDSRLVLYQHCLFGRDSGVHRWEE